MKKDSLLSSDGSSLEALLKGETLDKRTATELRGSEEDSNLSDYTGGLNPASRIRKVLILVDVKNWNSIEALRLNLPFPSST